MNSSKSPNVKHSVKTQAGESSYEVMLDCFFPEGRMVDADTVKNFLIKSPVCGELMDRSRLEMT